MVAFVVRVIFAGIIFELAAVPAGADDSPILNMGPSCDAAAAGAISLGRDKQECMHDEGEAHELLTKNWSQYRPADKTQCVGMISKGGPASYVELLSCLEIMKDAAAIHKAEPGEDVDSAGSIGGRRPPNKPFRSEYDDPGIRPPVARPPVHR
jgi:hypothetical protein